MCKVSIFCLLFSVVFSANVEAKESVEDRVNKVEGNLQELSVKVDLLGEGLQSISRSVSKILEHPEVKPLPDRTPNGLSRKKHLKLKPETDRLTDDLSRKKHIKMSTDDVIPTTILLNDTNLEERVTALEFQMTNVQGDIDVITDDVINLDVALTDLDEDVEAQITIILADISTIQSDQSVQDNRLLIIESDVEGFEADVAEIGEELSRLEETDMRLNSSLVVLESTVEELTESINALEETDAELTSSILDAHEDIEAANQRLSRLEVNGTVAFHAFLHEYTSIPIGSIFIFDLVYMNLASGYDVTTGAFTVPPGGEGLYYFFTLTSATNPVSLHVLISEKTVTSDAQQQNLI